MRELKEHDNRKIAKSNMEFITGIGLRKYMAEKVRKYLGDEPVSIFDGAIGSGQLEQYVNAEKIYGVEIQEKSYLTALENFPTADIENKSFFDYERENLKVDCVIMNPPFSIKFNDLSESEKLNIQKDFNWKKSGVVDDIFVLKSLKYTKRYGFYILATGVAFRNTEKKFRELVGNSLLELNLIENAFEDTSISVIVAIIDKEKTSSKVEKEIYDFKANKMIKQKKDTIPEDYYWQIPVPDIDVDFKINVAEIKNTLFNSTAEFVDEKLGLEIMLLESFGEKDRILKNISKIEQICKKYRKTLKGENELKEWKQNNLEMMTLF